MYLEKEIHEQPQVIRNLIEIEYGNVHQIAAAIREFDPVFVQIAARGTSDNAARYAQYLLGVYTGLPVMLATPSLYTLYDTPPRLGRSLTIGISQSGRAEDVRQVLADARSQGALTLGITNDPESPIATESHHHISLHAGNEISVAATKTYTAQLTIMAMLAAALTTDEQFKADVLLVPDQVAETLEYTTAIKTWVERYRFADFIVVIGRGYNYSTAFEIDLKVKELCYTTGSGYSEADFRHGPIAMVGADFPVIVVAPEGKTLPGMLSLLQDLKERAAEVIVISNNDEALALGTRSVRLPQNLPECLSPISAVVPGQVFGMYLALAKNYPVDKPRGLSKVTVTR